MCGLWGVIQFGADALASDLPKAASRILEHRGPDDEGFYSDDQASLVFRRLAILDLSDDSNQPIASPDNRYVLLFNGEIYNYLALADDLELAGPERRSDTAVLLSCFSKWGSDAIRRLNGMFAIALWDRHTATLTLARDQFGIKPLYYAKNGRDVVFASEIAGIRLVDRSHSLNVQALAEYLYFGNPLGTKTFYEGLSHVEPGMIYRFSRSGMHSERFATMAEPASYAGRAEDSAELLRETLRQAVSRHLVSDRPLALFLSGGLDSGSIASLAGQARSEPLDTISVHFDSQSTTDSELAALTAASTGSHHHSLTINQSSSLDALERLLPIFGEPFGDAAAVPLLQMCTAVGRDFTVVLQGDGGDELMGGYNRYRHLVALGRLGKPGDLARVALPYASVVGPSRVRRYAQALGARTEPELFGRLLTQQRRDQPPHKFLAPDLGVEAQKCDPFLEYRLLLPSLAGLSLAEKMRRIDMQILLRCTFLPKVDRATMGASLEARVPFLDKEFANLALSIPIEQHVALRRSKVILRRSMQGLLPPAVVAGRKMGFGVPVSRWMAGELGNALSDAVNETAVKEILSPSAVLAALSSLRGGSAAFGTGELLFRCLQIAQWSMWKS